MVLKNYFPLIEIQTNGLVFMDRDKWKDRLEDWVGMGLTHVALSIVHYKNDENGTIYIENKQYPDLKSTIDCLVECGLSIRLNCIGLNGYIDSEDEIGDLLDFARNTGHEIQVTWRPVTVPSGCTNEVARVTEELKVDRKNIEFIRDWVSLSGVLLYRLPHGAAIYDVNGQNFCLTNCLTKQPEENVIRQLIFADGRLRYDWDLKGAIIL